MKEGARQPILGSQRETGRARRARPIIGFRRMVGARKLGARQISYGFQEELGRARRAHDVLGFLGVSGARKHVLLSDLGGWTIVCNRNQLLGEQSALIAQHFGGTDFRLLHHLGRIGGLDHVLDQTERIGRNTMICQ